MKAFEIKDIAAERMGAGKAYLEFLREPALSVGLYVLLAGAVDPQQPHTEDEVYYVLSGRGAISVGDEEREVEAGTVVYVAAKVAHRFHSIIEDLSVLVFFAPAEYALRDT